MLEGEKSHQKVLKSDGIFLYIKGNVNDKDAGRKRVSLYMQRLRTYSAALLSDCMSLLFLQLVIYDIKNNSRQVSIITIYVFSVSFAERVR